MKHFKLTAEKIVNAFGVNLFRIELTIDCKWGKAGDKGGFIEKEENISGDAWVYGDAWEKSPLQIQGTRHFICMPKVGFLKIGCIELSINDWGDRFKDIGNENGYTESEIKEYGLYIELAKTLNTQP